MHKYHLCITNFNPLPRKEGDRISLYKMSILSYFNPLPRKEGDNFH